MPNRLAKETSPYLQQHADNPVDWYPWGEEALAESRRTGKPILLSIGYSACHWCHVMSHESFEDPATAKVMNEKYVNIKVDREERPDIDQIYQLAQLMLTNRNGGWPLTMFLTPDQRPFFGGTYFPDQPRYGMPSFVQILERVRAAYDSQPAEVKDQGERIQQAFDRILPRAQGAVTLDAAPLDAAADWLMDALDKQRGGFGDAPKFPHPDSIELLLRRWASRGDTDALDGALLTLRRMAEGGIYDHLGGGFARYSVDGNWQIPHFEKMLYDNAWLLRLYADAWVITKDPLFARVCDETCAWVMREMQAPDGGYYSSLDADSEGEEGKYYVWKPDEVRALLTPEEFALVSAVYGLDRPPNFEGHAWHLAIAQAPDDAARPLLDSARSKLFQAREKRVRPGRDDKVLASWNALMIRGMAHAARVFGRADWLASARKALDAMRRTLWVDGRLLATARDGRAHLAAYLDDHAYLLAALLEMMEADFRADDLAWATQVANVLMKEFHDDRDGGFFFTAHGHEALIHRPKPGPDNATPSGNATAAWALNRLSMLTGDTKASEAARSAVGLFWPQVLRQPGAFGTLLAALEDLLEPPRTVILTGDAASTAPWRKLIDGAYLPRTMALAIPPGAGPLPAPLEKPPRKGVTAWLCEGLSCRPPIGTIEQLQEALGLRTIAPSTGSITAPRS